MSNQKQDAKPGLNPVAKIEMGCYKLGLVSPRRTPGWEEKFSIGVEGLFRFIHDVDALMQKRHRHYNFSGELAYPFWKKLLIGDAESGQFKDLGYFQRQFNDILSWAKKSRSYK